MGPQETQQALLSGEPSLRARRTVLGGMWALALVANMWEVVPVTCLEHWKSYSGVGTCSQVGLTLEKAKRYEECHLFQSGQAFCVSYFPVAVLKHHDQGRLIGKGACGSRGVRAHGGREAWW